MSIPEVDNANDAAVRLPASVRVKDAASAECLGAEGLKGVTVFVNGRRTASAVWNVDGTESGNAEMKGDNNEGVE